MNNFSLYTKYYDLLNSEKKYDEECNYIEKLLNENFNNPKSILEFGSGTGIHGLNLLNKGYDVYGIENSPEMVEIAKKNGYECQVDDIEKFSLNKKFDSIIALFHVVSYLNTNEKLINTFKNAHKHLNIGGCFIFDVWYTPAVNYLKPSPRLRKISNDNYNIVRIAEPEILENQNVVNVDYEIIVEDKKSNKFDVIKERHPMRHFSIQEIKLLAIIAGFEFVRAEEFMSSEIPSKNTWGVCFILKKEK